MEIRLHSHAYLSFSRRCHKLKSLKSKMIANFLCEQSLNVIKIRMQVLRFQVTRSTHYICHFS